MKKYTLITGASSGIGNAIAKMFARRGKNLIIAARRKDRLGKLKSELLNQYPQLDILIKVCDLSNLDQVYQLYHDVKPYYIETWINNAGFGHSKKVLDYDLNRVLQMIRVDLEAVTILSTLYAKDYQGEDATLINVSSTVGYGVSSRVPAYSATKFYVSAFTEALYWEVKEAHKKLRVKVLAPAATLSEFSMVSSGLTQPINPIKFEGNTVEEMANFLGQLYDSEECLGYIETDDYTFHLSDPKIPHSLTKKINPNLLKK